MGPNHRVNILRSILLDGLKFDSFRLSASDRARLAALRIALKSGTATIPEAKLYGTLIAQNVLIGDLEVLVNLASNALGVNVLIGDLSIDSTITVSGILDSVNALIGDMYVDYTSYLAGNIQDISALVGDLSVDATIYLAGIMAQTNVLIGDAQLTYLLEGTLVDANALIGDTTVTQILAGNIQDTNALVGDLQLTYILAGILQDASALIGDLTVITDMFYVDSNSNAGTSVTIPTHQAGDHLYIYSTRNGSNIWPTMPSGWLPINASGANSVSSNQGFRIARSSSEVSGTWANATHMLVVVMRGAKGIGNGNGNSGNSSTLNYPGFTLADNLGKSWINAFAVHRTANNVDVAPTLLTNRRSVGSGPETAAHDSNGPTGTNWTSTNRTVSASSGWLTSIGEYCAYSTWINYGDSTYTRATNCKTITSGVATPQSAWLSYPHNDKRVIKITATQTGGSFGATIGFGDSTAGGEITYRAGYQGELGSCGLNPSGDFYINNTGPTTPGPTYSSADENYLVLDAPNELIWFGRLITGSIVYNGSYTAADVENGIGGISIAALASGYFWVGVSSDVIGDAFLVDGMATGHDLTTFLPWDA